MKTTAFLISIAFLCSGCSSKKLKTEELLIGKWRDENSLVEYFPDGTKLGQYDSGMRMRGQWFIEDNIVVFTQNNKRFKYNEHKIVNIDKDELVLENMASHITYHAKRVNDGTHLEFKKRPNPQKAEQGAAANP